MKTNIPENENLTKGIFALARQWKCFLAGTEKGEVAFYGSSSLKRRVVGRGVLTQRDRAILLREERLSRQEDAPLNVNVPGILETVHESPKTTVEQSKDQGLYSQMITTLMTWASVIVPLKLLLGSSTSKSGLHRGRNSRYILYVIFSKRTGERMIYEFCEQLLSPSHLMANRQLL